ncbi:hypothetical protein ACEUZ9_000862 [Paracoccus litorisediminis]|uniref:hypothetical protein n=1 Tax=Paracoccus litorisediminis TaxID=2006130 RepID=UPI003730036A
MARRPLLPSEIMVGRRRPKEPGHADVMLAGFLRADGTSCGRSNPAERYLVPAFTKLRKEGLIRCGLRLSFGGRPGPSDGIWYLTERGEAAAVPAAERVRVARAEIAAWTADLMAAHRKIRAEVQAKAADAPQQSENDSMEL